MRPMARRTTTPPPDDIEEHILDIDVSDEMRTSFKARAEYLKLRGTTA